MYLSTSEESRIEMKNQATKIILAVLLALAGFASMAFGLSRLVAQDPPTPNGGAPRDIRDPLFNYNFMCWSDNGGPQLLFQFAHYPFGMSTFFVNNAPALSDLEAPVITSVFYSGNTAPVETVKIPAATTSVQFSVSGTDNVGLQAFALYVDGFMVSQGDGGAHVLAKNNAPFAVRWNDGAIPAGEHRFRLVLFDVSRNPSSERVWVMTK
jgi:hypothetical protein